MVFLVWGGAPVFLLSCSSSGYSPDLAMLLNIPAILLWMTSGLYFSSSAHMLLVPALLLFRSDLIAFLISSCVKGLTISFGGTCFIGVVVSSYKVFLKWSVMIFTCSVSSVVFPSLPSINSCLCGSVILIDLIALYILVE